MSDELLGALKAEFPLVRICAALGVARSGVYQRRKRGPSRATLRARQLDVHVAACYRRFRGHYGAPRLARILRGEGVSATVREVAESLRRLSLRARPRLRFRRTTDSSHGRPSPPNLVERDFAPEAPNRVWVADTTYLPTRSGFVFLVVVLDLFARRVVGWSVGEHPNAELAALALQRAVRARRPDRGLIVHTDRGGEFLSGEWTKVLRAAGALASASATGCCYDNAVAESFFATLEFEGPRSYAWTSAEDAERELPAFIDSWYNLRRIHSFNDYRAPAIAEAHWFSAAAAA